MRWFSVFAILSLVVACGLAVHAGHDGAPLAAVAVIQPR